MLCLISDQGSHVAQHRFYSNAESHQSIISQVLQLVCFQTDCTKCMQDVFLPLTSVLGKLAALPAHAEQIKGMFAEVRQMEAVAQILLRKVDTESKYLARLEGNIIVAACLQTTENHVLYNCEMHVMEGRQAAQAARCTKMQASCK